MADDWYEEAKKIYGVGRLSEIKAELDVLFQKEDVDWEKEFVTVRVYDVARDAAHREASRYRGSKSFAASYMLIDGLHDERFKELYRKTYKMSRISSIVRAISARKKLEGLDLSVHEMPYELEGLLGKFGSKLRIYRPIKTFVDNLSEDMEIDPNYVISVLILRGSSKDYYVKLFETAMEKMYTSQIINMEIKLALARAVSEIFGSDSLQDDFNRLVGVDSEVKKEWKVKNVKKVAVEIARKVAKLKGVRIGDVVSDAIVAQYSWVLGKEKEDKIGEISEGVHDD